MNFTYDLTIPYTDLTRVRYETGDTVQASALWSDEEILFVLSEKGSVQLAVVSLVRNAIAKFSHDDDFKADWLQVDRTNRLAALKMLLQQKQGEYGLGSGTAGVVHRYRADSRQHEEPDYTAPDYDAYDDDTLYD